MSKASPSPAILEVHVERLASNIGRVHNLVSTYRLLVGHQRGRKSIGHTDVLRSAVVLLHASLEDFLRSLASCYLPSASSEVLNLIPLKVAGKASRAERFSLGSLKEHLGKLVDDLIKESVEAYLERSNYNNTTEIVALLASLEIDVDPCRQFFPELDKMMSRRHQIVHRADCVTDTGKGRHSATSLSVTTVERWIQNVFSFHGTVLYQLQIRNLSNG